MELHTDLADDVAGDVAVAAWAASGAMSITGGPPSGPVGPPSALIPGLTTVASRIRSGLGVDVDPLALLGERAAISALRASGRVSCGGATRLVPTADGWLALTLARPDDVDLVPALLELDDRPDDPWAAVEQRAAVARVAELVERGALLGLPVAQLPEPVAPNPGPRRWPVARTRIAGRPLARRRPLRELLVVDLTALWAGPLAGSLLVAAGATVVKVESTHRPDGARQGPPELFDLLNAGKQSVALDLRSRDGRVALRELLLRADVVLESSRPRALAQLGIDAAEILATGTPRVWASITGHGRTGDGRDRVAFGDDAAVAGGLVCSYGGAPVFCADAIADPATGLVAAAAVAEALATEGRWLLDISMAAASAFLAGPTLPVRGPVEVAPPRARPAAGRGPRLGEHSVDRLAGALA